MSWGINFASKTKGTATVCGDGHVNEADCKAATQAKMEELNRKTAEAARGKSSMSSAAPAAPAAKEISTPEVSWVDYWLGSSEQTKSSNEPAAAPQQPTASGAKTKEQLEGGDWF